MIISFLWLKSLKCIPDSSNKDSCQHFRKKKLKTLTKLENRKYLTQWHGSQTDYLQYNLLRIEKRFKSKILQLTTCRKPNACFVHAGYLVKDKDLEKGVYNGMVELRESEIAIATRNIIASELSREPSFKDGDHEKRFHWMVPFIVPCMLNIRMARKSGQKLNGYILAARKLFV